MRTIRETIQYVKKRLEVKGIEENAGLLLIEAVYPFSNRTDLFLHLDDEMQNEETLETYLLELMNKKPLQYILKKAWFCGETFYVDSRVLIPRMETEELVELVTKSLQKKKGPFLIFDVCTGSGCIALMLAKRFPQARIVASDISSDALEVAQMNQKHFHAENVSFIKSDLFCSFPLEKADIIVTNPPYIDETEEVDASVKDYEPSIALFPPSGNGLEFYQRLFVALPLHLKVEGLLFAEFGTDQKDRIEDLAHRMLPHSLISFYQDISGKDRFFLLQYYV